MRARYAGAFGTSILMHGALAAWLMGATYVPPLGPQQKPERQVEVVLLPPSEDGAFPGLKPVERSRGGAPIDGVRSRIRDVRYCCFRLDGSRWKLCGRPCESWDEPSRCGSSSCDRGVAL